MRLVSTVLSDRLVAHTFLPSLLSVPSPVKSKHVGTAFVPTGPLQMSTTARPETEVSQKDKQCSGKTFGAI